LSNYSIAPHLIQPFLITLKQEFSKLEANQAEEEKALKSSLKEIQQKIDGIEEQHYIAKSMPDETYQKFFNVLQMRKQKF
jgi:predicted  nucleic acid-binding Zn-ribbon protein